MPPPVLSGSPPALLIKDRDAYSQGDGRYAGGAKPRSRRRQCLQAPSSPMHLAHIAHEFRTPLTAIRGALELIASRALGPLTEPAAHMLAIARANSDRLLRLVEDILTTEVLAAGQLPMRWEIVDLAVLVEEAMLTNASLRPDLPRPFTLAATLQSAHVRADRGRLLQVLANLLSNAVKFSPPGAEISLALRQMASTFRITITDQGPGIPEDFRPHVFQRFARAPATAGHAPGSGLGLNIARAILSQHGGEITFESPASAKNRIADSPKGQAGASFHVDLPFIRDLTT